MELGGGIKTLEQKDFSVSESWTLWTPGQGTRSRIVETEESAIPPAGVQSAARFYEESECYRHSQSGSGDADSHAGLSKKLLEGWTQLPVCNASSHGNAALPSDSVSSSSPFDVAPGGGQKEINLQCQSSQNECPLPNSQKYNIHHSSPIIEKVVVPVTPDKCKRSGGEKIEEGNWFNKNDPGPAGKGSVQMICFSHYDSKPANVPYVGFPLQSESQQQEKTINLCVDLNSNKFCQLGPVTPEKFKRAQSYQLAEVNVAVDRETGECREKKNDTGPRCKEPVEICLNECTSKQADLLSLKFPQQHDLLQEIRDGEGTQLNKTPPQKARRKRHRPKVIIEGKPARKPKQTIPKLVDNPDDPPRKKRSIRKKETSSMESPSTGVGVTTEPQKSVRKSAKKSLNFDLEEIHVDDGFQASTWASKYDTDSWSKTSNNSSPGAKSTLGILTEMVDSSANTAFNLEHSVKQLPENQVPFSQLSRRQILRENLKDLARKRDRKKIQCSCDSTMPSAVQVICPPTPQIRKNQGSERDCSHKDEDLFREDVVLGKWGPRKSCNEMNGASEYHYSIYNQIRYVPEICKKRRTDNRQNKFAVAPMTSSFPKGGEQINDMHEEISSFVDAQRHLEKMHAMDHMSNIDQMERNMSQPSKSTILKFKLSSQATGTDCSQLPLILYNPMQGAERWVASIATPLKVPRKRRTKKESKSTSFHRTLKPSFSSRIMMSHVDPIDFITQRLQHLNINRSSDGVTLQGLHNDNALVLYTGGGAVVPFEGFFTPRKQHPRAKVDLDSETNRVWMLLMGKDNGNCPEGTDNDKEKWWEEERKVFQGRADSFIARMHLVQGDRRFSKWKGSVVDSVAGVFLTQNVSDHLSSSAFMSLVARFPKRSGSERIPSAVNHDISTESEVISVLECSDNIRKQEDQLKKQQTSQSSTMYNETQHVEESRTCMFGYSEDSASPESRIELESVVSSQNSVVSSQHSSESAVQMVDRIGLSSESNSEIEGLEAGNCLNRSHFSTSFTELLQMTGRIASKEISESESSLNKCDVFRHTNLVSDHLNKLGGDISMDRSNFDHCPEQHDPAEGACAASAADLSSACETGCAMMDNVEIVRESQSFLSSSTSGGTSTSDAVKACIIDGPLKKNTTEFHIEEKSVYTDSYTFIRNHPFQPFPCSREDAYWQSHSCNCNYIPSEKTQSSPINEPSILLDEHTDDLNQIGKETNFYAEGMHLDPHNHPSTSGLTELSSSTEKQECIPYKATESIIEDKKVNSEIAKEVIKPKRTEKKQVDTFDWDSLRKEACSIGVKRERSVDTMDSIDWEAVRRADVSEISHTIRERGMNNMLAARIKDFLDRLVRDHGSIDLEWLRDAPPDRVKDYLLSIRGLGLKSVECVRLLTLEHLAFPVDTNVGRICVRLGWVPLKPLPESLQLHLLELYPMLETIQKYLWPRLCTLDQRTLYELHYQMITFGKVFCTKSKPNCNACPMRGECKHFASAFASARLALPGPEDKSLVSSTVPLTGAQIPKPVTRQAPLLQLEGNSASQEQIDNNCEPIIEEPATPEPEPEPVEVPENAIEDAFYEDPDEIPMIRLNIEQFTQNLQTILQENNELQDGGMSKALVALSPEAASIPQPKLKNINRLRTEHQVYELPDGHPLLDGLEQREPDDPCPYLLAIWTPGETARSMESPKTSCSSHLLGKLCESMTCFSCNSIREEEAHIVRGTLLIPCRTAMRGSFPLNGTYFQVNEVFADHHSSLSPLDIPRELIWNLPRRTVYFGTSVPTIFRGLTTEGIQHCFWKGFVCVRGFDQKTRAPRPLLARLHFPASKAPKNNKKTTTKEAT